MNQQFRFILASQSPRRKELIGHLGIPFEILLPSGDEDDLESHPQKLAISLAKRKAHEVLGQAKTKYPNESLIILAADTVVALSGKLYGKPSDLDHARQMLKELADRTHEVCTGVCLCLSAGSDSKDVAWEVTSQVVFRPVSSDILEHYLSTGESFDKAGAYGIQGAGLLFIDKVLGSYSNVVGLPIDTVVIELKKLLSPYFLAENHWRELFV